MKKEHKDKNAGISDSMSNENEGEISKPIEDNGDNGETNDMSHIEDMADDMTPEEQQHMHKHLTKKLNKGSDKEKLPKGANINDFQSAMEQD